LSALPNDARLSSTPSFAVASIGFFGSTALVLLVMMLMSSFS
jgi:hypothetical protein